MNVKRDFLQDQRQYMQNLVFQFAKLSHLFAFGCMNLKIKSLRDTFKEQQKLSSSGQRNAAN